MKETDRTKRRSRSVRGKITVTFLLFTLIAIALLWLFQFVFLDKIYRGIKLSQLETGTEELIGKIGDEDLYSAAQALSDRYDFGILLFYPETGSLTELSTDTTPGLISRTLTEDDCRQMVRRAEEAGGRYLFTLRYRGIPFPPNGTAPNGELPGFSGYTEKKSDSDQAQDVIYTTLFEPEAGITAALLIRTTITPLAAARETLFYILTALSVLLVILALALATYVSRAIVRPIVAINDGARHFSNGDYSHHFSEEGSYREAEELAATLNQASADLSKVETMQRELIANISHDLRTPLTLISGYSEAMRDLPGEVTPENLQTIVDESARLTSLVNDLLEISQIQSGNRTPHPLPFSVTDLLNETVATYQTLTACQGYTFELETDCEATVCGDRQMIIRALNNLINNALTYTGKDRLVQIRQICTAGRVRIEVTDTGEGIPKEKLRDIWDRYYKIEENHRRPTLGTGLGLSIVKSILSLHGGSWGVRSSPGNGSTFWIEMDRYESL